MNVFSALDIFQKNKLDTLIWFATSRCNMRCATCFYWQRLNQADDLSHANMQKVIASSPRLHSLMVSGGEPFLREDLAPLLVEFADRAKVEFIALPTNGLLKNRILDGVREILENSRNRFLLTITVSVDGFAPESDRIRGVPGGWEQALDTLRALCELRAGFANLQVGINSVVCRSNIHDLLSWRNYVRDSFALDLHNLTIIRGGGQAAELTVLSPEEVQEAYRLQRETVLYYLDKSQARLQQRASLVQAVKPLFHLGALNTLRQQHRILAGRKTWEYNCLAGRAIAVIDANGDFRACELRPPLFNLERYAYNLSAALKAPEARREVEQILLDQCFCTHGCFINTSFRHYPGQLLSKAAQTLRR